MRPPFAFLLTACRPASSPTRRSRSSTLRSTPGPTRRRPSASPGSARATTASLHRAIERADGLLADSTPVRCDGRSPATAPSVMRVSVGAWQTRPRCDDGGRAVDRCDEPGCCASTTDDLCFAPSATAADLTRGCVSRAPLANAGDHLRGRAPRACSGRSRASALVDVSHPPRPVALGGDGGRGALPLRRGDQLPRSIGGGDGSRSPRSTPRPTTVLYAAGLRALSGRPGHGDASPVARFPDGLRGERRHRLLQGHLPRHRARRAPTPLDDPSSSTSPH